MEARHAHASAARRSTPVSVDFVVPVRNEADNIPLFLAELRALPLPAGVELRVIFVEDGSTDATLEVLRRVAREQRNVRFYSMERGFGEGPAVLYGASQSKSDALIMMAVESHPLDVVPRMIEAFLAGAEVVQCVRSSFSGRSWYRDLATGLFGPVSRVVSGWDPSQQNVYYRLVSRDLLERWLQSPRHWRLLRFPLPDERSGALQIVHASMVERVAGQSKYDPARLLALGFDGILTWMSPIRLLVLNGILAGVAALLVWLRLAPLALFPLVSMGATSFRYLQLRRVDYLREFAVRETSESGS